MPDGTGNRRGRPARTPLSLGAVRGTNEKGLATSNAKQSRPTVKQPLLSKPAESKIGWDDDVRVEPAALHT